MGEETPPDLDLARRLVATQFPQWAGLAVRPVEHSGWDNRTFRLGDDFSIRLPRSRFYREQVAKEQYWLPRLAPHLPVAIPRPVAQGAPGLGYPYDWSVYAWIEGTPVTTDRVDDLTGFARDVATFLVALRSCDATGGPLPGQHNWWRGGPLDFYLSAATAALQKSAADFSAADVATIDAMLAESVASRWSGPPVWFHGDVAFGNLLVRDGRLAAVIDFGTSGIGDPACDLVLAWSLLSGESRRVYIETLDLDADTWARGRGWALWKALITPDDEMSPRVIREILADPDAHGAD